MVSTWRSRIFLSRFSGLITCKTEQLAMFSAMILAKRTLVSTGLPAAVVRGSSGPERIVRGLTSLVVQKVCEGSTQEWVLVTTVLGLRVLPTGSQEGTLGHCLAALVQQGQGRLDIGHDMARCCGGDRS